MDGVDEVESGERRSRVYLRSWNTPGRRRQIRISDEYGLSETKHLGLRHIHSMTFLQPISEFVQPAPSPIPPNLFPDFT